MALSISHRVGIPRSSGRQYWTQQKIAATFLFDAFTKDIAGGKLYNTVKGREAEYLTVTGSAGSYHYTCPNNATYIAADTDYAWFKTDGSVSDMTDSRLNSYDLQRTPVLFDDDSPNTNRRISILLASVTLTSAELLQLHHTWRLPIMWSGGWIDNGYEKSNRSDNVQNIWTVEQSATVEDATRTHLGITFNHNLDTGSVPATSAFAVTVNGVSRGINSLTISGAVVTLVLASACAYGDTILASYTQPGSNPLKEATGDALIESFSNITVLNNIAQTIPTILTATVETAAPSNLVITFNQTLNTSYVPATTDNAVLVNGSSRAVNSVAVAGARYTLTLASPCVNGDTISVSYTKPVTNFLRDNATGGAVATFNGHAITNNIVIPTSYLNAGGSGDRHLIMSVSRAGFNDGSGTPIMPAIIDGHKNNDYATYWYPNGGAEFPVNSSSYLTIDCKSLKIINEVKIYINHSSFGLGIWKWQGSNNNTDTPPPESFIDLTGNYALQCHPTNDYITDVGLSTNTTPYRHYRLIGVSGSINNNITVFWEFEFKISA